jgi:hypothetical protein
LFFGEGAARTVQLAQKLDYRLNGPGLECRWKQNNSSSPKHADRLRGPPSLLCNGYQGPFPTVRRLGREVYCLPPSSAGTKNQGGDSCLYGASMAWARTTLHYVNLRARRGAFAENVWPWEEKANLSRETFLTTSSQFTRFARRYWIIKSGELSDAECSTCLKTVKCLRNFGRKLWLRHPEGLAPLARLHNREFPLLLQSYSQISQNVTFSQKDWVHSGRTYNDFEYFVRLGPSSPWGLRRPGGPICATVWKTWRHENAWKFWAYTRKILSWLLSKHTVVVWTWWMWLGLEPRDGFCERNNHSSGCDRTGWVSGCQLLKHTFCSMELSGLNESRTVAGCSVRKPVHMFNLWWEHAVFIWRLRDFGKSCYCKPAVQSGSLI